MERSQHLYVLSQERRDCLQLVRSLLARDRLLVRLDTLLSLRPFARDSLRVRPQLRFALRVPLPLRLPTRRLHVRVTHRVLANALGVRLRVRRLVRAVNLDNANLEARGGTLAQELLAILRAPVGVLRSEAVRCQPECEGDRPGSAALTHAAFFRRRDGAPRLHLTCSGPPTDSPSGCPRSQRSQGRMSPPTSWPSTSSAKQHAAPRAQRTVPVATSGRSSRR